MRDLVPIAALPVPAVDPSPLGGGFAKPRVRGMADRVAPAAPAPPMHGIRAARRGGAAGTAAGKGWRSRMAPVGRPAVTGTAGP